MRHIRRKLDRIKEQLKTIKDFDDTELDCPRERQADRAIGRMQAKAEWAIRDVDKLNSWLDELEKAENS